MPHTALYRKYRPRAFREMVGQGHVVRALSYQLISGQVSHAYLFCGTRGTGKTSAAKILARAVNCLTPQQGEPCNTCEMCAAILAEKCLDVNEIDAASNNGVDNIRDLRDEVRHMPQRGRYRVYIIDEVHMLTGAAFNALLKTLEEPPAHVIFILATTDPQKLPATILSRCQRYDFKRIEDTAMIGSLEKILGELSVEYEREALAYIAYHSDGAMRDALSLLDQCISLAEKAKLTESGVRAMLGAVDRAVLADFTRALQAADSAQLMQITDSAMAEGRDVAQLAADLVRFFRDELVGELSQGKPPNAGLISYITAYSELLRELRFAPHMRTAFEVCTLRLCSPQAAPAPMPTAAPAPPPAQVQVQAQVQPSSPPKAPPKKETKLQGATPSGDSWPALCATMPPMLAGILGACTAEFSEDTCTIYAGSEATVNILKQKAAAIREAMADFYKLTTPPTLDFRVRGAYNKKAVENGELRMENKEPESTKDIEKKNDDWAAFGTEF